jgi:hypothetical protein
MERELSELKAHAEKLAIAAELAIHNDDAACSYPGCIGDALDEYRAKFPKVE